MKKSVLMVVLLVTFWAGAFSQPGVIDQSFGNNGKIYFPIPRGTNVYPVDIKVQPDQKILALVLVDTGLAKCGGNMGYGDMVYWMYKLLRFHPNGTPDSSFAVNGSTPVVYHERPSSMELLANGKILLNTALSTSIYPPCTNLLDFADFCLTRYNANGTIDNSFGTNGRAITRFDSSLTLTIPVSVFVLPSGKIIQVGSNATKIWGINMHNLMAGFDQNGNIDPTFGNNGKVKVLRNGYERYYCGSGCYSPITFPYTFLMQSNQKIIATADSGMYRFNSNGSLDATFGTNGFRYYPSTFYSSNFPGGWGATNTTPTVAGTVDSNDKIVLVITSSGIDPILQIQQPRLVHRLHPDGSHDSTFQPFVVIQNSNNNGEFACGKIFSEPNGQYSLAVGFNANTQIAKLNSNGAADYLYGKRGRMYMGSYPYPLFPNGVYGGMMGNAAALQADGKMLVGGIIDTSGFGLGVGQKAWVINRFEKNARVKYNTLVSDIFYDHNSNGIKDTNETPFMGQHFTHTVKTGSTDTAYWWYSQSPTYKADLYDVDTGSYRSWVNLINLPYYTAAPAVKTTSHSTYWNTDTVRFAVQPIANIRDLSVTLVALNKARPGFQIDYLVKVQNVGTDSAGNIKVKMVKSDKVIYNSATLSPASVVADTITWNLGGLKSQQDAFFIINGTVKAPPIVNIGDEIKSIATITSNKADTLTTNDTSSIWQVASGAFDPNDKAENHGGKIALAKAKAGEYLTYTIRFQNTGNDTAFNVYIRDTMDSKLDWSSLQILASSHNYKMTMNDGRCLFTFPLIMLVDSIKNEPLSHGYIVYKIKAKPTVQLGDVIKNTAAIYFDYNLPIFTNTEKTTVVAETFPLKLLSFIAKRQDKTNLLQWATTQEVNVDGFEVQRSHNGREFNKIGAVKAGNTSYSFTDDFSSRSLLERGGVRFYYRLKMIDKDGSFSYSPVRLISNNSNFSVVIYPNPAMDKLQIQITSDKQMALQMQVVSLDGKMLLSNSFTANEANTLRSINISSLPRGSYLLKVSSENKEEQTLKFEKL